MTKKTKNIIGWILTVLVALALISSAGMKLMGSEMAVKGSAAMGLSLHKLKLIGIVELISALLFIFPRTGIVGTLLVAAYMGGAIATHLEHFMPVYVPVIIESLTWIAAALRFPELTQRLMGNDVFVQNTVPNIH